MSKSKINKFLEYLIECQDDYVIIGGTACEVNLELTGIKPRITKDFDIVLCVDNIDSSFSNQLGKLISDGNYQNGFSNSKRTSYRFIKPKEEYPKQLELFASSEFGSLSIDKHLSKLNIVVNDEEISSIVIDKPLYDFIKSRRLLIGGLSTIDRYGLILLKVVAYFKNKERFDSKLTNKSSEYKKHNEDIIRLIASFKDSEVVPLMDYPQEYLHYITRFVDVLKKSNQILINKKMNNIKIEDIVNRYNKIFNINANN